MKKILLPNRDGLKRYLEQDIDGNYVLTGECYPVRIAMGENGIRFVDTSGGEPIGVGSKIEGVEVEEIEYKDRVIFKMKKNNEKD